MEYQSDCPRRCWNVGFSLAHRRNRGHPTSKVRVPSFHDNFQGLTRDSDTCAKNPGLITTQATKDACSGAFLMLHITPEADFYGENTWGWTSDHELDLNDHAQINIYTGR